MTESEAQSVLPLAQAVLEEAWRDKGLSELGVPVAKIVPSYRCQMDPVASHNALCEITINGRLHGLCWEIYRDEWAEAFRCVARLFAVSGHLTQDVATGDYRRGQTLLERVRAGAD